MNSFMNGVHAALTVYLWAFGFLSVLVPLAILMAVARGIIELVGARKRIRTDAKQPNEEDK